MEAISKEHALEAYNLIRNYCGTVCCEDCLFVCEDEEHCLFDFSDSPCGWVKLEIS